jgi:hypothetical protein
MRGVPNRSCSAYGSIRVMPVLAAGDAAGAVDPQAGRCGMALTLGSLTTRH